MHNKMFQLTSNSSACCPPPYVLILPAPYNTGARNGMRMHFLVFTSKDRSIDDNKTIQHISTEEESKDKHVVIGRESSNNPRSWCVGLVFFLSLVINLCHSPNKAHTLPVHPFSTILGLPASLLQNPQDFGMHTLERDSRAMCDYYRDNNNPNHLAFYQYLLLLMRTIDGAVGVDEGYRFCLQEMDEYKELYKQVRTMKIEDLCSALDRIRDKRGRRATGLNYCGNFELKLVHLTGIHYLGRLGAPSNQGHN
jgi:hypothetical protein